MATPAPDTERLQDCRVLVVDDNEQNRELIQAYLEDLGCEVLTATDGLEALSAVASQAPDLILLDVMMPRMSGYQACVKLKNDPSTKHIPVIMVTALTEIADQERAVEAGADDFISKPVNKVELLTRVRVMAKLARAQRRH